MNLQDRLGGLWAQAVEITGVDLSKNRVDLRFSLPGTRPHEVRLEGVTSIVISIALDPGEYDEASEVGVIEDRGELVFGIVLWDEPNEIAVRCREIWLNDEQIASARGRSAPS